MDFKFLVEKYSSSEMKDIFSDENEYRIYRKIWTALAEAEQEAGLDISDAQISQMRENIDKIDMDTIDRLNKKYGNITIATIEAFGIAAPLAEPIIHLGATTNDLWDNTNIIRMKQGTELLIKKMLTVARNLRDFVMKYKDVPTLGFTRLQAAQPVTVGKRAAVWLQDAIFDIEEMQRQLDNIYFRGLKGATGTQASFLSLLDNDKAKVEELDRRFSEKLGFSRLLPITSQIFTRKIESRLMSAIAGIAETAQKIGNDIRVLAGMKEMEEPIGPDQVGSSTMAYKRNPWIAEDLAGYARFLITLLPATYHATGQEMLEQSCDNLAVRLLSISNIFLTADVLCEKLITMTGGFIVYEKMILRHIEEEMPFLATENVIMEAVKKGGDRQKMHHILKEMSMETVKRVRMEGLDNNMFERIAEHSEIPLDMDDLQRIADPVLFTGMAATQVENYVNAVVDPFLAKYKF